MQIDATEDSYFDRDLFSLSAIKVCRLYCASTISA